jgi:hypothetical protein
MAFQEDPMPARGQDRISAHKIASKQINNSTDIKTTRINSAILWCRIITCIGLLITVVSLILIVVPELAKDRGDFKPFLGHAEETVCPAHAAAHTNTFAEDMRKDICRAHALMGKGFELIPDTVKTCGRRGTETATEDHSKDPLTTCAGSGTAVEMALESLLQSTARQLENARREIIEIRGMATVGAALGPRLDKAFVYDRDLPKGAFTFVKNVRQRAPPDHCLRIGTTMHPSGSDQERREHMVREELGRMKCRLEVAREEVLDLRAHIDSALLILYDGCGGRKAYNLMSGVPSRAE